MFTILSPPSSQLWGGLNSRLLDSDERSLKFRELEHKSIRYFMRLNADAVVEQQF